MGWSPPPCRVLTRGRTPRPTAVGYLVVGVRHPDPPWFGPPVGEATSAEKKVRAAVHSPGWEPGLGRLSVELA